MADTRIAGALILERLLSWAQSILVSVVLPQFSRPASEIKMANEALGSPANLFPTLCFFVL